MRTSAIMRILASFSSGFLSDLNSRLKVTKFLVLLYPGRVGVVKCFFLTKPYSAMHRRASILFNNFSQVEQSTSET